MGINAGAVFIATIRDNFALEVCYDETPLPGGILDLSGVLYLGLERLPSAR
jgi:hypothetical protein